MRVLRARIKKLRRERELVVQAIEALRALSQERSHEKLRPLARRQLNRCWRAG